MLRVSLGTQPVSIDLGVFILILSFPDLQNNSLVIY